MRQITIGQYYPTQSVIHALDPRVKIIYTFLFMIAIFLTDKFYAYALLALLVLFLCIVSKIPIKFMFQGLRTLVPLLILTFLINALMGQGDSIFRYGIINITYQGLRLGFLMLIRLLLLVIGSSLMTLTTSPMELTDGIEKLLNPFRRFGLPSHEIAMMMSIALRFIPTLMEETDKIMKAQMARGADFESKNLIHRAKSLLPLLVPLFISAFKRADELAIAMEARCYRGGEGRTRMNEILFKRKDYIYFTIGTAVLVGIVGVSRLPFGI